jgi:hypothetical protein
LVERIGALEKSKDGAARRHEQRTAPLQAERESIEEQRAAAVVDGLEIDPAWESRTREIYRLVEESNVALQREVDEADDVLRVLREELNKISRDLPNPDLILKQLFESGPIEQRRRHYALTWVAEQLANIVTVARRGCEQASMYRDLAKDGRAQDDLETLEERVARWQSMHRCVLDVRQRLNSEAADLRRAIIEAD